jgi:hypothetical protein
MMPWSRPEMFNVTRELSRFMTLGASGARTKAMLTVMDYFVNTEKRELKLEPNNKFNGNLDFKLVILGRSDSNFMKDPDTFRSVSGNSTFLCVTPVAQQSNMQKIVALSLTKAELFGATSNAQYMM